MKFSEAEGHKVVSTSSAETVGRVSEFVVDPASRQVVAVEIKKAERGDLLAWPDIAAFGADAVTVAGAGAIGAGVGPVTELLGKDHHLRGKRLLTAGGDELGKVTDVEFDPATGAITALLMKKESVDGARLIGVGSYAVVVSV
ncbi:PRC-barrel domain-containing protein [uncultured Amnibacterium sp.]|uniref:PRC-barrel domain-containing protein n=1 Tax=uncultured Amnibacterium sp. TaxID=1631851 RepID=UPI0035CA340D